MQYTAKSAEITNFTDETILTSYIIYESTHARTDQKRNSCGFAVGKPEGKTPLRRHRRRWENNIKMDLSVIRWGGTDWTDLTQDREQ
jgi:hypothetical protein